jgi:hypothetical protein
MKASTLAVNDDDDDDDDDVEVAAPSAGRGKLVS